MVVLQRRSLVGHAGGLQAPFATVGELVRCRRCLLFVGVVVCVVRHRCRSSSSIILVVSTVRRSLSSAFVRGSAAANAGLNA